MLTADCMPPKQTNAPSFYLIIVLCLICCATGHTQTPAFLSGGSYLSNVPAPEAVLGYSLGSTFTRHEEMVEYVNRLAAASERVRVDRFGTSNERRGLYLLQISSPENLVRLEEIRTNIGKLADPRKLTNAAEASGIIASSPLIVWLNYGIHGDESAAFEAAMQVAYQLAAGTDSLTLHILKNVVTLLNMCHNPESHERFVTWYNSVQVGSAGTADPNAAEHHDPWGMNTTGNHYQIDLNRDWFIASQVETQAVLAQYLRWQPQVLVDHHGETDNYFFGPQANPLNANIPPHVRRWFEIFAAANAKEFDRRGWSYYGREDFDEFYPGYSSAWACLNGAVGMTYETDAGGDRGLQVERWDDDTIVTLRDGIQHHFTASITTLATAAQHRESRLRDFYEFKQTAIAEGRNARMRRFLLVPQADPVRCRQLVQTLLRQGIEVHEATAAFQLEKVHDYFHRPTQTRNFPAGAYVIEAAQPQRRLLTAILEPEPFLDPADTLASGADPWAEPYYDLTAWALPYSFNVESYWSEDGRNLPLRLVTPDHLRESRGGVSGGQARYAYIFSYETNSAAKLLARLLQADYVVMMAEAPFEFDGKKFARGSVMIRVERNRESLHADVAKWSRQCEVEVLAVHSAWTASGLMLGSPRMARLTKPRLAVITGPPVNTPEYGALWHMLERDYEIEFTALQMQELRDADLKRYNVIVFPDDDERWAQPRGYYRDNLRAEGVAKLRRWVEDGGTFVGIKGGAILASSDSAQAKRAVGLSQTRVKAGLPKTPGTIFQMNPNSRHLLSSGFEAPVPVLLRSPAIFSPSARAQGVFIFDEVWENLKLSGVSSKEDMQTCAGMPFVLVEPVERGQAILFADDPIFRLAWHGLARVFLNAVLLAPSLVK